MRTLDFDPAYAWTLTGDLYDAAGRIPTTPTIEVAPSPTLERFTAALARALAGVDKQTFSVHDRARVLAEESSAHIDTAVGADQDLGAALGRLT
ncbi:hypothetical protein [Corynebacterium alimapuense]|uniref:Uncharacterized protein n=1 Tax=Corynebacterium alimapuense TaxID=1576874 RepID=A0A3M8K8G1_9CORY|nr:hypothetical protein [Corynebacterium alimapuense]RNE48794.1 hypothetical protein C5L39_05680 [Corynebacterium alimapuense]